MTLLLFLLRDLKGVTAGEDGVLSFSYGSFHFNLSTNNDIVGKIWENGSEVKLLGDDGYTPPSRCFTVTTNTVIRFSSSGGALCRELHRLTKPCIRVCTLLSPPAVFLTGKYVIAAKVPAEGEYKYFALKIIAVVDPDNNNITYEFDISEKPILHHT